MTVVEGRVSVIVPTHNRVHVVAEAVGSALGQSHPDTEVVVVDDGSTDGTLERLSEIRSPRLKVVRSASNGGAARARNLGITSSSGEYVAFLDSDDRWQPGKLEAQLELFRKGPPELGLVYSGRRVLLPDGSSLEIRPSVRGRVFDALLCRNTVPLPTVMVKRAVLDEVGLFDPLLPACEDWDLVLRIAARYALDFVPDPDVLYDGTGTDRLSAKARRVFIANHLIFRRHGGERPGRRPMRAYLALQSRELMGLRRYGLARRYALASLRRGLEGDERLALRTLRDLMRQRPVGRMLVEAYLQRGALFSR